MKEATRLKKVACQKMNVNQSEKNKAGYKNVQTGN